MSFASQRSVEQLKLTGERLDFGTVNDGAMGFNDGPFRLNSDPNNNPIPIPIVMCVGGTGSPTPATLSRRVEGLVL
jgi:hypothetical protein